MDRRCQCASDGPQGNPPPPPEFSDFVNVRSPVTCACMSSRYSLAVTAPQIAPLTQMRDIHFALHHIPVRSQPKSMACRVNHVTFTWPSMRMPPVKINIPVNDSTSTYQGFDPALRLTVLLLNKSIPNVKVDVLPHAGFVCACSNQSYHDAL